MLRDRSDEPDVLHPKGKCTCSYEGRCDWCRLTDAWLREAGLDSIDRIDELEGALALAQERIEELEAELGRASSQRAYQVGAGAVSIEWTSRELGHIAFVIDDDDKARKVELLMSALGFVPKRIHRATDWSALAAETTPEQLADTLQAAFASGVQQGRVLERRGGAS